MALFEARGLSVRFGGHNAVTEVDVDVEQGSITGLIGPNGAGKTTIFNAITGLQEISAGTLTLDGRDITHDDAARGGRGSASHARFSSWRYSAVSAYARTSWSRPRSGVDGLTIYVGIPTAMRTSSSIASACASWPMNEPTRFRPVWPASAR